MMRTTNIPNKAYVVLNKETGEVLSKSTGNSLYIRQGDSTKRANRNNKYHKTEKYVVMVSHLNWKELVNEDT
jgi:hypothetical protein